MDPWFCASGKCVAVVGNYLVYRDSAHITRTYMRRLAPVLRKPIKQALRAASRP